MRTSYGYRRFYEDLDAERAVEGRPYHASALDRICHTEARLGRGIRSASELPDLLSQALWWKMRRWYFDQRRQDLSTDDPAIYGADAEYYEALEKHALLIRELWVTRLCDREERAWARMAPGRAAILENA